MMEFSDGNVWVTNDSFNYYDLMGKTEEERRKMMDAYINNVDRKEYEEFLSEEGATQKLPEVVALWSALMGNFDLISI